MERRVKFNCYLLRNNEFMSNIIEGKILGKLNIFRGQQSSNEIFLNIRKEFDDLIVGKEMRVQPIKFSSKPDEFRSLQDRINKLIP